MSKNLREASSDDDKPQAKRSATPRNVAEMPSLVSILQSISGSGSSNQLTQDAYNSVMDALRSYNTVHQASNTSLPHDPNQLISSDQVRSYNTEQQADNSLSRPTLVAGGTSKSSLLHNPDQLISSLSSTPSSIGIFNPESGIVSPSIGMTPVVSTACIDTLPQVSIELTSTTSSAARSMPVIVPGSSCPNLGLGTSFTFELATPPVPSPRPGKVAESYQQLSPKQIGETDVESVSGIRKAVQSSSSSKTSSSSSSSEDETMEAKYKRTKDRVQQQYMKKKQEQKNKIPKLIEALPVKNKQSKDEVKRIGAPEITIQMPIQQVVLQPSFVEVVAKNLPRQSRGMLQSLCGYVEGTDSYAVQTHNGREVSQKVIIKHFTKEIEADSMRQALKGLTGGFLGDCVLDAEIIDVRDQLLNNESLTPPAVGKKGGRGGKRGGFGRGR